jgi:putative acetyltransferase
MILRDFRPGDERALRRIFLSAIHGIASRDYNPEQIQAWAPADLDLELWAKKMRAIRPFVIADDGTPIAYADLQPNGYIDHFFVSAPFVRQGVGSRLMRRIQEEAAMRAIPVLTSDVSRTAQPFFRAFEFVLVEEREPLIRGVIVPNARMEKNF